MQKLNPHVRIIAASGLVERNKSVELVGVREFLSKPFNADSLLRAVHTALKD